MAKRFLFLDDDPERHSSFDRMLVGSDVTVTHVWTADECIETISNSSSFDQVFLDHDLGGMTYVSGEEHNTGTTVAKFISTDLQNDKLPKGFVIHSWNGPAAQVMERLISTRGVPTHRIPFKFYR